MERPTKTAAKTKLNAYIDHLEQSSDASRLQAKIDELEIAANQYRTHIAQLTRKVRGL